MQSTSFHSLSNPIAQKKSCPRSATEFFIRQQGPVSHNALTLKYLCAVVGILLKCKVSIDAIRVMISSDRQHQTQRLETPVREGRREQDRG